MDGQDELYDKLKDIEPNIPTSDKIKQPKEPEIIIPLDKKLTESLEIRPEKRTSE